MRPVAVALIALILLCGAPGWGATKDLSMDAWMGVYIGPNKVGYQRISVEKDKFEGKDVYRMCEVIKSGIRIQGRMASLESTSTLYLDSTLKPLSGVYERIDDGVATRTEARFLPDRIECKKTTRGGTATRTVVIPPGTDLSLRPAYQIGLPVPAVGESRMLSWLDPSLLAIVSEQLRVVERKEVTFRGSKRSALVIHLGKGASEMIDWRLEGGEIIRPEVPGLGIVMTPVSSQDALADTYGPELGIVTTNKPIPDPRHANDLTVRLTGVSDRGLAKSDSRQSARFNAKDNSVTYRIRARAFDAAKSAKLPIKRKDLAAYTKPGKGIESDDAEIISQARSIVGGETSAYRAACKLRAWVQANLKPSDDSATPLSAAAVLRQRTGCCRHNAVLYAALARAAGIPTRLAAGLVYDEGAFRFHVWAESWVGQWVALDPTYPGDFVDATRIKLVDGGVEELAAVARVAGRLRAEVVSFE